MNEQARPSLPAVPTVDEADLRRRLSALGFEQKVRLLTGADFWSLYPEPAAGLRRLVVSDGPAGVRGELWDERDPSANVPSPTALAATWDEERVQRLGALLAGEARRKGVDVVLAPTVNLHRTPYGGRHFECFSEDPLLTARIGVAYVRGLQGAGVGATVKHFVANDSETERMLVDVHVDERTLRELYLAPFEAIVREGGAWSLMAAYNQVDGTTMTESPLVRDIAQDEWGFDGVTMSDWFAARSTVPAASSGLDLVMPGPAGPWGDALVAAVKDGLVAEERIDDHVLRILRLAARVGALDGVEPAVAMATPLPEVEIVRQLREGAAAGMVLATNQGLLPLVRGELRRVAVIGPNAEVARTLGGGSATVYPAHVVSPLEGLRAALPGVRVEHGVGVRPSTRASAARDVYTRRPDGSPGVLIRFLDADGREVGREERQGGVFNWMAGLPFEEATAAEVEFRLVADRPGIYHVGGSGLGPMTIAIGGEQVASADLTLPPGADLVESIMAPPQLLHPVTLAAGEAIDVRLTSALGIEVPEEFDIGGALHVNVEPPHGTDDEELDRAVELAAASDVVVLVVGTTEEVESEGYDRHTLALPGRQDELVRRVADANPRTVVVVNSGSPVLLPWADEVAAVLLAWFPGQEFGDALADVLLGVAEPGGRLPTTWPVDERNLPSPTPVGGRLEYTEGRFIGYRDATRSARFPFGHGLGYTTWEYLGLSVVAAPTADVDGSVEVTVRNSGSRRGREVVQVYLSRPGSAVSRPLRWLAGFAGVVADPGEEVTVTVPLASRSVQHWDVDTHRWATEVGRFVVEAGPSCAALPLSGALTV